MNRSRHFATKVVHTQDKFDKITGAVMPPIHLSTTFAQTEPGHPISEFEYSRSGNPTRQLLENSLAVLEQGKFGLSFASGLAALHCVLQTLPKDSHIILSDDVYGGTHRLIADVFRFDYTTCDLTNLNQLKKAIKSNTRLLWLETPSNPLLKIIDIASCCDIIKQHKGEILFAVDNTFATPALQNPLTLGADLVCHSMTKYLGGHTDIVGGALIVKNQNLFEQLQYLQNAIGAVPSPFDCYLLIRSLKTLSVRMQAHSDNAMQIAEFCQSHPKIEKVYYPGLASHPQHSLASQQMSHFGGMISLVIKGGQTAAIDFLKNLNIFTLAESLGGVESLCEHPGIMTHATIPESHRARIGIHGGLVRLSVGIEAAADLMDDIARALQTIS